MVAVGKSEEGTTQQQLGSSARALFCMQPGLCNLNNGSYGACPRYVMERFKEFEEEQESRPDSYRFEALQSLLPETRKRVAALVKCDDDELAFVPNVMTGVNAVLRDLILRDNDAILMLSCTYGGVRNAVQYVVDSEELRGNTVHKVVVSLTWPCSAQDVLDSLASAIDEAQQQKKRIRLAIIDAIASMPGVQLPWQAMVQLLRSRRILSLVDAAHGVGFLALDLHAVDPDFLLSACHKWLFCHRSCAILYVPRRNQDLQRASLPVSWSYVSKPTSSNNSWSTQWLAPGTTDLSAFLSVGAALDFQSGVLGGEERIREYIHSLAVQGGQAAARILGTEVMENEEGSLTACMANVRLPVAQEYIIGGTTAANATAGGVFGDATLTKASEWRWQQGAWFDAWFYKSLLDEFDVVCPVYEHDGKLWARMSAQVWLTVEDFKYAANALRTLCRRITGDEDD